MQCRDGRFLTHFSGYIIDDVIKRSGWLITDKPVGLVEAWDASLHILKSLAVGLGVWNIFDLASTGRQINGLFCKLIDRDFLIAAEIDHLAKTGRSFQKLGETVNHIRDMSETPRLRAIAVNFDGFVLYRSLHKTLGDTQNSKVLFLALEHRRRGIFGRCNHKYSIKI